MLVRIQAVLDFVTLICSLRDPVAERDMKRSGFGLEIIIRHNRNI